MSKNAYFTRYHYPYQPNPNIIIVPTVSLCPPPPHTETEQLSDPNTSIPTRPTLHCEQITPINDNNGEPSTLPCRTNCNQQNLEDRTSNKSTKTDFSDNFKNSQSVIKDKISTETPESNKSQSIRDLSTSKYKSRHKLVDLTGFNLPNRNRRSTSSLPKHKDLRQTDDTIENDKGSYGDNEHRDYPDHDNYKTDNIEKKSPKSEKPMSNDSGKNTENFACELKESEIDMDNKNHFEQLSRRDYEKLKDIEAKEKHGRAIKNTTKQDYKDLKEESSHDKANLQEVSYNNSTQDLKDKIIESCRSTANVQKVSNSNSTKDLRDKIIKCSRGKVNLQKVSKSNSTKDLRNKIKFSSKKYRDLETRLMVKHTRRSKSETNSRHLPDSKVSIRDRKKGLRPDSIRHNDDHEIKYKSVEKYTDKERAKNPNNTGRVKLIKSVVVPVNKNAHDKLSQSKRARSSTPTELEDLRLRLSRKRPKSEYFVYQEPVENRIDQESLMITIEQDVKADSKKSPILAPTVKKPKSKKCKKIKVYLHIDFSNFDSDSSEQDINKSCSSLDDLSFLDDFNIDEIVDSLNISQVEPNKTITKDNDYINNEQTKPEEDIINDISKKTIELIKKEDIRSHKGQVIDISSDDDDMNIEMGSVGNLKKCKDEQNMDENPKVDRNINQEPNNITHLTGKGYEKNKLEEIIDHNDEQNIKLNSKVDRNIKEEANYIKSLTGNDYEENKTKETMDRCNDEAHKPLKTYLKIERNTKLAVEAYNETDLNGKYLDKNAAYETINLSDDDSDIEVIDISDKNERYMTPKHLQPKKPIQTSTLGTEVNLAKSKFQLKPSVNKITDLNNKKSHYTQHEDTNNITAEQKLDPTPTHLQPKKPIQTSTLGTEVNLAKSKFQLNTSVNQITDLNNKKSHYTQHEDKTDITTERKLDPTNITHRNQTASLQTIFNIDQNKSDYSIGINTDVIKQLNTSNKKVIEKNNNSQTTKNSIEQNTDIKINSEQLNVSDIKENHSHNPGSISKKTETEENILKKAKNKMDIIIPVCRSSKDVKNHLQTFEDTANKSKDKSINNIEQNTINVISLPKSKSELIFDSGNSTKGTFESAKKIAENCPSSPKIDIRPQSSLPERSNIQHKTNASICDELTIPDKNIEVSSRKTSTTKAPNLLTANNKNNKSNVGNQTKSETVNNNTEKLKTIDDACDLKTNKHSGIATNTKTKQQPTRKVVSNKSLVLDGSNDKDEQISNKTRFFSSLQSRMSEYLQKKFTLPSFIHKGRNSVIFKCLDNKGKTCAVKVVRRHQVSRFIDGMTIVLQQSRPKQDSFVLYLRSAFKMESQWCLLTEYYPKNLEQALREQHTRGFHIDQVQVLSRQLVDAVNMLTNAGIIHSDITPTHILLNSANDRLKLCGFDRSNYSTCMQITPGTGSASYRAPEVILGFQEDHRTNQLIDVWSTALVIFEMVTKKRLFPKGDNNCLLYLQLCTLGNIDYSMLEQSRYANNHFSGTSFIRKHSYQKWGEGFTVVNVLKSNNHLRGTLFRSYQEQWVHVTTKWQMWNDMNKLELLHTLLQQMLVIDPRKRLPIQFIGAASFMDCQFRN